MKFPRQAKALKMQWDAAPLAGVFFVLLLFLLLHQSFVFVPGVKIDLPPAEGFTGAQQPAVTVALDAAGQAYFLNQPVMEEELRRQLRESARKFSEPLTLVLQMDRNLAHAHFVRICQVAREAGIERVVLGTQPPLAPALARPVFQP